MFKVLCGSKPYSEKIRAKKYNVQEQFLSRNNFLFIMKNLPVKVNILLSSDNQIRQRKQIIGSPFIQQVSEVDINEMFSAADSNQDGNIRYSKHILSRRS